MSPVRIETDRGVRLLGWRHDLVPPHVETNHRLLLAQYPDLAGPARPAEVDLRPFMGPVLNQLALGACGPNAVMDAARTRGQIQLSLGGQPGSVLLGARLGPYWFTRFTYGLVGEDSGVDLATLVGVIAGLGFCAEEYCPYSDEQSGGYDPQNPYPFQREPSTLYLEKALLQKGKLRTSKIDDGTAAGYLKNLEIAIANQFPIPYGALVSEDFVHGNFDPTVALPATKGIPAGGHAMEYVGYGFDRLGNPAIRSRTSWGEAPFGPGSEDGTFLVSPEFVTKSTSDAWAITDAPTFLDVGGL